MTETTFNPGDIVYHKANNLRMVVVSVSGSAIKVQYVTAYGKFDETVFIASSLSERPIEDSGTARTIIQLESKATPSR